MSELEDTVTPNGVLQLNPEDDPAQAGYDSGDNVENTDVVVQDPVLAQYQKEEYRDKWCEELEASRKERKQFVNKGYQILARWGDRSTQQPSGAPRQRSKLNLLYRNSQLKQGAVYARTPQPDVKRRWNDSNDQVARVAGLLLSRVIEFELDDQNFDHVFNRVLFDRIVPGLGIAWVRLEQKGGHQVTGPHWGETLPDGTPHPEAQAMVRAPIEMQMAHIDHVPWDDLLWSPCRTWGQSRWMARRLPMSKQAIEDRFGSCCPANMLNQICYETEDEGDKKQEAKSATRTKNQVESTTDVFEIWDKELRLVWFVCESCPVPLDVQEDTNEFPGFYPTPHEPLGTFDGSNTIPYADYMFTQDLYEDIDETHNRLISMIQAAQVKFFYDGSNDSLKDILTTTGELQGVPVQNWSNFKEKGGAANAIDWLPWQQMAAAAQELTQAKAGLIADLDDIEGLNDILKAEAATNETVLATQMKGAYGTTRLAILRKQVAKYCESLLRLKAHLICRFYDPEIIMQRVGTLTETDMQLVPQAIQLLKNEEMRGFRLSVSVDALQSPDWSLEKADKIAAVQTIGELLQQGLPAVQQNPRYAPILLTTVKWLITSFKDAQVIEGELDAELTQLAQMAAQGQQQQAQPNPAVLKAQAISEKTQADVAIAQEQEKTKRLDTAINAELEEKRLQLEGVATKVDTAKAIASIHSKAHDNAIDKMDMHDQQKNTVHNHAMDIHGAQPPVIPIPIPVGHNGKVPNHVTAIVTPK